MPTKRQLSRKLRSAVAWLRRHFPTRTPSTVRVSSQHPDLHGLCLVSNGRAIIRLTPDTETVMIESLIEEHCHVLRHDCPVPIEDEHDALFWAIMAVVTKKWRDE
jgi:hypothetical protein